MVVLSGADEMEEGDGEEAGTAEGVESDESGSLGEAVDDTFSWVNGCFESVEAEQEYWDRQDREKPLRDERDQWEAKQWAGMLARKRVDCKRLEADTAH
mmetsp:Transcript_28859/g.45498  ORF Transcript_28859/g.45498 Transcript_28859/m.45498 type:complete len:99 (+) Transcript_28859:43-339(+)|eukprot:CAMPEP_0194722236 /NCGR_PEP_ID=MMETSP0296-20130528/13381_1 /TAXON_ID=39354 /ORGANISM="Heterosigma akashiwo, Strain CCMP2393" /LENGTH=98 /DNA_ID=CAMNT_0039625137 /DNA_START=29 /DNA_END=325 /DNA_ORIENTATION=-